MLRHGFGFDAAPYGVAMAVGERVLLSAVRAAGNDELVLADGFSCREQIARATSRRALHLAGVVHLAMSGGPAVPAHDPPERNCRSDHARATLRGDELAGGALVVAGLATAAFALRRAGR